MRVAMLDPSLFTGRYDDSLCAALARAGQQVILHGRPMRPTDAIQPNGYCYAPSFFPVSERMRGLLGEGAAFRAIKAAEYLVGCVAGSTRFLADADVLHVQWLPLPLADGRLLARLRAGRRRPALIHTVHNASAFHGDSDAQARGYRKLLETFDALIVHGETTRNALVTQGLAADRLHVVPHPPMALAPAPQADMAAVRDPARPRILFFGTIRPYKGFDLLVGACLSLWRAGLDFELAVAGKPFMNVEPLIGHVRDAGFADRLILDLGFLTEPRLDAHLRKADIIAFPYRDIDSSGAFLSSLHYGKAIVATNVGMFTALPDCAALLCPPEDEVALALALRRVLTDADMRTGLGAGATAMQASMGNWDDAARATVAVYERVTGA